MPTTLPFRVADLAQNKPTSFELRPTSEEMAAVADELGLLGLRKLSFSGRIAAQGSRDWVLTGQLGATVVQSCVVTLDPVSTRIDTNIRRSYLADIPDPEGDEVEMPEDDTQEPLGTVIDPGQVMIEALALALPLYPRKEGIEPVEANYAAPGVTPMTDEDTKPFAGLASLRDALKKDDS